MKKFLPFLLFIVLLVGCGGGQHGNPHALLPAHPAVANTDQGSLLSHTGRSRPETSRLATVRPVALTLAHRRPRRVAQPKIEIDPFISQVLHASTGTWTGNPTSFAYQWQRCDSGGANCVSIAGAIANTYTVITADAGSTIRVMVTATNNAGSASQTSAATTVVLATPFNTSPPVVSGTTTQGQVLSTSNGAWNNSPTSFAYQWKRCDTTGANCANIAAATASTYTLVSGDVGSTIRAQVTATNLSGSAFATSQQSAVIAVPAGTGTTYYVDNQTGSNSNPGTSPTTAWASISQVNATTLTHDQSVLFKGGQTFTGELDTLGSGTSGHPITYSSYGTGKAILLRGGSGLPLWISGEHDVTVANLVIDGNNASACVSTPGSGAGDQRVVIDNDEIRNCGGGGNGFGVAFQATADANNTIQNSFIHNTTDTGILFTGPSHTSDGGSEVIQGNRLQNVATTDGSCGLGFGGHGVYGDSTGLTIRNNDIGPFSCDGGQAISARFGGLVVEGNAIHDGPTGIENFNESTTETDGQLTNIVRYNRFYNMLGTGTGGYGIFVSQFVDHGVALSPENWSIYNNTFYAPGARGVAVELQSDTGTTLRVQNNVTFGSWGFGQYEVAGSGSPTIVQNHNDWAANGTPPSGTGNITATPNLTAAPAFAPHTTEPASPVIDAGTATVTGASFTNSCNNAILDYCGSAPDMGAIEFQTGVSSGPTNLTPPLLSGSAIQGQSLSATTGTWSGSPTSFAYQWQACDAGASCTNIAGQTGSSYNPLLVAEVNHTVRVAVTATNAAGSNAAFSAVSAVVAPSGTVGGTPTMPVVGNAATVCDKYASPSGSGTGTIGSPWSLATMITSLTAGQVGCLRAGTYGVGGNSGTHWSFNNSTGVTITGFPGEAATINGWADFGSSGTQPAQNMTVTYLNFDENYTANTLQSTRVTDGCTGVAGTGHAVNGALIDSSGMTFSHNNVYQTDVSQPGRSVAIGVGFNAAITGVKIDNNFIHDYSGCADEDHGVYWDQASGEIKGNWIWNGPFGAGIQQYSAAVSNVTISGNTIDNTGIGFFTGDSCSGTCLMSNNVVSNTVGFQASYPSCGGCGGSPFVTGGLAYSSNGAGGWTWNSTDSFNNSSLCNPCGGVTQTGTNITSDPQYTNSASADYRTQAGAVSGYGLWNGDAGSAVSDPTLFGKASVGGSGAGGGGMGADLNRAITYTAGKTGTIKRMVIYLVGGLTAGTQTLQANVYADSSGTPGSLLATSAPISFSSTGAAGWYDLTLTSPLAVTSGTHYWLSILSGATGGVAGFRWDSVAGSRLFQTNAFGSGPINPYGTPISSDDEQMSFYAIVQ